MLEVEVFLVNKNEKFTLSLQEEAEKQKKFKTQSEEDKKELERLRAQAEEERLEKERLLAETEEERREKERLLAETEEERREKERLLAQAEEERRERARVLAQTQEDSKEKEKEIERLRTETQKVAATKDELAKDMQKAQAELQRLEEEKEKLKEEKRLLEEQVLKAENEIQQKELLLQKVHELIDFKEENLFKKQAATARDEEPDARAGDEQLDVTGGSENIEVKVELDEEEELVEFEGIHEAMKDDEYWFAVPATFSEAKKNRPSEHELQKILSIVPDFVGQAIMTAMPEAVITGIPQIAFWYNQRDRLPNWTVIWFMRALRTINNRCSDESLFFRAIHLIEAWREKVIYGESWNSVTYLNHFLRRRIFFKIITYEFVCSENKFLQKFSSVLILWLKSLLKVPYWDTLKPIKMRITYG